MMRKFYSLIFCFIRDKSSTFISESKRSLILHPNSRETEDKIFHLLSKHSIFIIKKNNEILGSLESLHLFLYVLARTMDGRFGHGRFGQDVLATDVLATYIEKTDVLAKSIIYVLIIDIKATNIFNLLI